MNKKYDEAIENASQVLIDAMLGDIEELVENGRLLDVRVRDVLRRLGVEMMVRLFAILSATLVEEAKERGFRIERRNTVTFKTLFGPVEVESPYLLNDSMGEGLRPMRETFGVVGEHYSDACERALSHFGSDKSFEKASEDFAEHYGWQVGRTTVRSRTRSAMEAAERYLEQRFTRARQEYDKPNVERQPVEELLVQADGCLIRCGEFMTAEQARQRCDDEKEMARLHEYEDDDLVRLMEYKEVRTGLVRRPEQVKPTYVCTRADWEQVADQLFAVGCEHGLGFDTQVVGIGDGGNGIKESLEMSFARLQYILDYKHLKDHITETAQLLNEAEYLEDSHGDWRDWREEQMDRIYRGEVLLVIADMESQLQKMDSPSEETPSAAYKRLERLIKHLTKFSSCVDYKSYLDNEWPIGSGEGESAHKTVPQRRLKVPGATWKVESLNGMCALRVVRENGWWDEMWQYETSQRQAA